MKREPRSNLKACCLYLNHADPHEPVAMSLLLLKSEVFMRIVQSSSPEVTKIIQLHNRQVVQQTVFGYLPPD